MKTQNTTFVRASISFPADIYESLKNLAKQKKVSLAWVVRDAAEKYVAELQLKFVHDQKPGRNAEKLARRAT